MNLINAIKKDKIMKINRRSFLKKSSATAGLFSLGTLNNNVFASENNKNRRLPREVWIAGLSQMKLIADSPPQMVDKLLNILSKARVYKPDIVCLPEIFPFWGVYKEISLNEKVEESVNAMGKISGFSKDNNCYSICPVYTKENHKIYNSAVVFDRQGSQIGEYRKIHTTESEMKDGISPGSLKPPVFKTDFGIIGIQICFDLEWDDGWKELKKQGAEIVFFPSAFPGGQMLSAKAWRNRFVVASSTNKHDSKLCDISGDIIDRTGIWNPNLYCAPVNLEKVFLHLYPYYKRFDEIQQKYGQKIRIKYFDEEEWGDHRKPFAGHKG